MRHSGVGEQSRSAPESARGPARSRGSWRFWRAAFAALLLVHLLALYWPRIEIEGAPQDADKWTHLLLFGAPVGAAFLAVGSMRWLAWLVVLFLLHAPVSEILQARLLPGRSGDVRDALFDAAGVVLGVGLGTLLRRRATRPRAGRID
jgi:hypothetical protein